MKKLFSFILLCVITLGISFSFVGCDNSPTYKKLMFMYNRTTYSDGANIVFNYGDAVDFNKENVSFIGVGRVGQKDTVSVTDLTATYEYTSLGGTNYLPANVIPFFEGTTSNAGCGVYRFTFTLSDATLQFTVTVVKADIINKLSLELFSDSDVISKTTNNTYVINSADASLIRWKISNMTDKESQQLGSYPELYVLTPQQYQSAGNRENYNGTLVLALYVDVLGTPGEYYIYGKFAESGNYKGGNTNAIHVIVN